MNKVVKYIALSFIAFIFFGCGDAPPTDYIEQKFVEAFLIVDEPFQSVKIERSLPLQDSFKYENAMLKDADVRIIAPDTTYNLVYRGDKKLLDYYLPDTSILVKPNTTYKLEVRLKDGTIITGETTTPGRFQWITTLADTIQYPRDTLTLKDGDTTTLTWQRAYLLNYYMISVKSLDTLEYGKYLNPPTDEKNRRIVRPYESDAPDYQDITRWGLVLSNSSAIVWTALKWFGMNELDIFTPDANYLKWFVQYTRKGSIDPLLSSVKGAYGVFGSASRIKKVSFVKKNQP